MVDETTREVRKLRRRVEQLEEDVANLKQALGSPYTSDGSDSEVTPPFVRNVGQALACILSVHRETQDTVYGKCMECGRNVPNPKRNGIVCEPCSNCGGRIICVEN